MNEEKKRRLVYYVFITLAFIVFAGGVLVAWHEYETVTDPYNRWLFCDCCYGECVCNAPLIYAGIFVAAFIYLVSLVLAGLIAHAGISYYMCGRFKCPEEECVEVEWWGE